MVRTAWRPTVIEAKPEWLRNLRRKIKSCLDGDESADLFGMTSTFNAETDIYTFLVYPKPVEVVGGSADGSKMWESFSLDVTRLMRMFDKAPEVSWGSRKPNAPSSVRLGGLYRGHSVVVCVSEEPPPFIKPKVLLDWETQKLRPKKGYQ
jgi:hypothetical protein